MRNERKRARAPGTTGNVNPLFTTPPSPAVSPLHHSTTPLLHHSITPSEHEDEHDHDHEDEFIR
jgi:hypothetical protein